MRLLDRLGRARRGAAAAARRAPRRERGRATRPRVAGPPCRASSCCSTATRRSRARSSGSRFGRDLAALQRLAAEGRPLGIHVVATADRRAGVPGGLAGVVPERVVLRMADDDDYAGARGPAARRGRRRPAAGRGFTREGRRCRSRCSAASRGEQRRSTRSRVRPRGLPRRRAPPVATLPAHVARPAAARRRTAARDPRHRRRRLGRWRPTCARTTSSSPAAALRAQHRAATSRRRCGRHARRRAASARAAPLAARRRPARGRRSPRAWTQCRRPPTACSRCSSARPARRRCSSSSMTARSWRSVPALETLVRRGRDAGVRVLAAVETHAAQRAYGGWLRELRNGRRGAAAAADPETDGELLGVRLPRGGGPCAGRAAATSSRRARPSWSRSAALAAGLQQRLAAPGDLGARLAQRRLQPAQRRLELAPHSARSRSAAGPCQVVASSCPRMEAASSSSACPWRSKLARRAASCSGFPPRCDIRSSSRSGSCRRSRSVTSPLPSARRTSSIRFWFCGRASMPNFANSRRRWVFTASTLRKSGRDLVVGRRAGEHRAAGERTAERDEHLALRRRDPRHRRQVGAPRCRPIAEVKPGSRN